MKIKNIKINKNTLTKKIVATGLTLVIGASGYSILKNPNLFKDDTNNEIGYENINPYFNFKVKENNFVILNVGNHEEKGIFNQKRKIEYANENNIQLGLVINSNFEKENEIYDDVEYIKSLVRDFNIDFPIYMNIDDIIENDDLNVEFKTKLIKDFLDKASANNMYVGLYGTDTNLTRLEKYCNIREYDAYLVMDKENITYTGVFNIYKDLENNIKSKTNLENIIKNKDLNNPEKFTTDGAHLVSKNEELIDIAMQYGLSVNELLQFNKKTKEDIKIGSVLRIPSLINQIVGDSSFTFENLETPLRGADLSYAQGTNSNYETIAKNFDFLIIRVSQGKNLDTAFEYNIKNAIENNIPVGVYCYNDYKGLDYADKQEFKRIQEEQADFVVNSLKNKKIDYPVYLDLEVSNNENLKDFYNKEDLEIMINTWIEKMEKAGYVPGFYSNKTVYEYISNSLNQDLSEKMSIWIAGGDQYTGETKSIDLNEVYETGSNYNFKNKNYQVDITQVTDSAINSGAGNSKGHVDVNYSYVDYANKIKNSDSLEYYFDIKEFNRNDYKKALVLTSLGLITISGLYIGKKKIMKVKKK